MCGLLPLASILPSLGAAAGLLYAVMVVRAIGNCCAFTGALILVNAAAHPSQLGAVNGFGQSVASLVRGLGPALGGLLWSSSLALGGAGHQFLPFAAVSLAALGGAAVFCHPRLREVRGLV
jgi:hypothetical protein